MSSEPGPHRAVLSVAPRVVSILVSGPIKARTGLPAVHSGAVTAIAPYPSAAPVAPLAARPRLLPGVPVVPLRDGSLQVGCDADRGVRLPHAPAGTLGLLRQLTGEHTVTDLAHRSGMDPQVVDDVVEALRSHRLLARDTAPAGPFRGTEVARLVGDVPVVVDLALGLIAEGVERVQVVDPRGAASDVLLTVRHRLVDASDVLDRLQVVDHIGRRPLPPGTPTVLATGRLEVDPAEIAALVRNDDPHVVARPRPGGVLLGPFVVPGRTSCLACADLARASRDASWVEQRAALTGTRADIPASLVPWVVTTLLAQLACWAVGGSPDLVDRTVEMGVQDWRQRWRAWRTHPRCGCR